MTDKAVEWLRSVDARADSSNPTITLEDGAMAASIIRRLEAADRMRHAAAGIPVKWEGKIAEACAAYDAARKEHE